MPRDQRSRRARLPTLSALGVSQVAPRPHQRCARAVEPDRRRRGGRRRSTQLLEKDVSPHVRIAAAHGLARVAVGANKDLAARITAALENAARQRDGSPPSSSSRRRAARRPPRYRARNKWRTFQVVDRSADDAPVRQEPYFVQGPDDVVWASYTDARGEINSEHIAPETEQQDVHPASREAEY